MDKVSIVIPSRNEQFLAPTVNDVLTKATGDIEVIVILDGYWPDPQLINEPRLHIIHRGEPKGMRAGINAAVAISKGKYIMKLDAHCMLDQGYDEVLKQDLDKDWISIPRRYRLDAENWKFNEVGKPPVDYEYLTFPNNPNDWGGAGLHGHIWDSKNADPKLKEVLIDDQMSFQGSCWFMHKDYFNYLELMDDKNYGTFWQEAQEIGLKCWLSGGRVITNKKTWYAHLHKGKVYGRGYRLNNSELDKGANYTKGWITKKMFSKQIYPLSWLIEKFWPVPSWPKDRSLWQPPQ